MKGEGYNFYSSEEVLIAYNEQKVDLHAIINLYSKSVNQRRVSLSRLPLVELFSIK